MHVTNQDDTSFTCFITYAEDWRFYGFGHFGYWKIIGRWDLVMQLAHKIEEERSMTSKLSSLRGKTPLHYANEQFLDDSNDKTSFLYIRV